MKIQFSLRDLLLVIAIVALAAGWWIDHQRINKLTVQKWEFKVEDFFAPHYELKNAGSQGWEICGACYSPGTNGSLKAILKRPIR